MITSSNIEKLFSSYSSGKHRRYEFANDIDSGKEMLIDNLKITLEFPNLLDTLKFHYPKFSKTEVDRRILAAKVRPDDKDLVFELMLRTYEFDFQTIFGESKALQLKKEDSGLYVPRYVRVC